MKNIICSSTRGWNCGDDFILFGIRNILSTKYPDANFVVQNRHPVWVSEQMELDKRLQVKHGESHISINPWQSFGLWRFFRTDNSWHSDLALDQFDLAVFAGSPEWQDLPVKALVSQLVETDLPVLYLGVGSYEQIADYAFEDIKELDRTCLQKARLITVRDAAAAKLLAPVNAQHLPCPALFSTKGEKKLLPTPPRIAFCPQFSSTKYQYISHKAERFLLEVLARLSAKYDVEIVCHYSDELRTAQEKFGATHKIRYSYDPRDYEDIYARYDLNVTSRVHGAGICASLGIPSFVLCHSARSGTVDGFLAEKIDFEAETVDDVVARIDTFDRARRSDELRKHKYQTMEQYFTLLDVAL